MRRASRTVPRAALVTTAIVALGAPAACSVLLPLSDYDRDTDKVVAEGGTADGSDGSTDAGADVAADAGCVTAGDNCGACGRSCLGEPCVDGRCATKQALKTIAVIALTVTDTAVFATTGIVGPNLIGKLPLDLDTTQVPVLLGTTDAPTALTVGGDRLFWGDNAGVLSSVTLDLAPANARIESEAGAPFVAQVAGYLGPVWTSPDRDGGGLYRSGGLVKSAPGAWGLVIDNEEIFYAARVAGGSIKVVRVAGEETLVSDAGIPIGIAVDASAVYWADCLGGTIRRFDRRTRATTTLAQGQAFPYALIGDGDFVYWTTLGTASSVSECEKPLPSAPSTKGEVVRVRKDGTGVPLVLARDQELPISLSARPGQGYVYWGSATVTTNSGVWRTAK